MEPGSGTGRARESRFKLQIGRTTLVRFPRLRCKSSKVRTVVSHDELSSPIGI